MTALYTLVVIILLSPVGAIGHIEPPISGLTQADCYEQALEYNLAYIEEPHIVALCFASEAVESGLTL